MDFRLNLMMMLPGGPKMKKSSLPKNGTVKWKDSPHLNNLKRGVEKHGEKWTKILHDKTLNLPNVSADALRNAYTKYFKTKQRIVTPRKPLPPPLRPRIRRAYRVHQFFVCLRACDS